MTKHYRTLTPDEIQQLSQQGCRATDWSHVAVHPEFQADRLHGVALSGRIRLGRFSRDIDLGGGVRVPAGIYQAACHNCEIGDNVLIRNVGGEVANADLGDNVVIDNIDRFVVTEPSSFGNNTLVATVNEAGGREVPLYDRLSAPLAYLIAFHRQPAAWLERISGWIAAYARSVTSPRATIGAGALLQDCGSLINTRIGPAALLKQVRTLENGTVLSCPEHPTVVGPGVIARHFIMAAGATVTDASLLNHTFVGQGAVLKQFKAEHSLFFANCEAYLGEACAAFAGPYTVTHHQGTLLIATYLSFFNAGSSTNQSNHMYRLGPCHQGILERGCKTGSGAYLCWPAHIGAFSFIKGHHYSNPDLGDLPFSYLIEKQEQSWLHPGAVLGTVGLVRDARKWSTRDQRHTPVLSDPYRTSPFTPYTLGKVVRAETLLANLLESSPSGKLRPWNRVQISRAAAERGLQLYRWIVDVFLGDHLLSRLEGNAAVSQMEFMERLCPAQTATEEPWADLAGLLVPNDQVLAFLKEVGTGKIPDLNAAETQCEAWADGYEEQSYAWAWMLWQQRLDKDTSPSAADVKVQLQAYKEAVEQLHACTLADAAKEFAPLSRIGYGLDTLPPHAQRDFESVRGTPEDHAFLKTLCENMKRHLGLADTLIAQIDSLPSDSTG